MSALAPLRLRCPADSPRAADRHLAIDVRLPCDVAMLSRLAKSLPHCGCGAELVIDTKVASADAEDRSDARIADLERAASSLSDEVMQRRAERDTAMRERDALRSLRGMDAERIAKLEEMLRAVLDTAPEGGAPWVVAMARARKVLDGAEKIVRANVIRPEHAQEAARRGGTILAAIEALQGDARLPVVLVVLRELLNDAPDEAEALDRAVVEGVAHYGVEITAAHRDTAARILEEAFR